MIEIKKVSNKKGLKHFIQFREKLYRNDKYAVPYLNYDEMTTLHNLTNPAFEFCEADYFLAMRDGEVVGRVAAIINKRANEKWDTQSVRFGWFDFIDDEEVSETLLRTVEEWGRERGMTRIVGPMGFTDMDREGLLVEGYLDLANMSANYNYPYYQRHVERLGFTKDNDYTMVLMDVPDTVPEKMQRVAKIATDRFGLRVFKASRAQYQKRYGQKVFEVLNQVYSHLYGYSEMTEKQIQQYIKTYIRFADPNLVVLITDPSIHEKDDVDGVGKIVGFGISMPNMSRALQKIRRGSLFPWGWWHLLKVVLWHDTNTVDLMLLGVLPEYRKKGGNALVFSDLLNNYFKYGFTYAEALPMMETNNNVQSNWEYFNSRVHKRLRVYAKDISKD